MEASIAHLNFCAIDAVGRRGIETKRVSDTRNYQQDVLFLLFVETSLLFLQKFFLLSSSLPHHSRISLSIYTSFLWKQFTKLILTKDYNYATSHIS